MQHLVFCIFRWVLCVTFGNDCYPIEQTLTLMGAVFVAHNRQGLESFNNYLP